MAVNTTNYGFIKPDDDDFYDIQLENANWDKADEELKKLNSEKVDKVSGKQLSANDYTTAEKTKLAGVAANANNYTHPSTHPASVTVQDATHRFATDAEKTAWNGKVSASGGDLSNTKISAFTASAAELPVPAAGDTAKVFSGKIKKFFEDIKAWKPNVMMKSMVVNNFTTTVAGMVADARALKTLYDHYAQLNSDLNGYYKLNGGISIPDNADINSETFKIPGTYHCVSSDRAKTLKNSPFKSAFKLIVDFSNGTMYPRQTFIEFHTNKVYRRTYDTYQNNWMGEVSYITNSDYPGYKTLWTGSLTTGGSAIIARVSSYNTYAIVSSSYPAVLWGHRWGNRITAFGFDSNADNAFRMMSVVLTIDGDSINVSKSQTASMTFGAVNGAVSDLTITHLYGIA